jgi:hypothetical protein
LVDQGLELVKRLFVRAGLFGLLFYASCGGRTTLVDLSEQAAGDGGVGGSNGGSSGKGGKGGTGGKGGKGGTGGIGGATGGVGGSTGGAGGGPAGTGGVDYCTPDPCQNGGLCYSAVGGWVCRCPAGTFGEDCSGNVNECNPNPCVNGDCEDEIGGFNCACYPGFTGAFCEIAVTECLPNPCLNGGVCSDQAGGFACACPDGWLGDRCEIRREPCNPSPCLNGGICIDQMTDFLCACPPGYTGERCETPTGDDCPSPNPCQNGGICKAQGGGAFVCECAGGFEPPLCQCRGGDVPQSDGSCVLQTVCGHATPDAFGSGDCSENTTEFADWWCQLGGYAEASAYTVLTSGVLESLYYDGGAAEVLSACAQVTGPSSYGYQTYCTGVDNLACRGTAGNALRSVLMACGGPSRDPRTFIPPGTNLSYEDGCTPNNATQALMITRNGVFLVNGSALRAYLNDGGIVITEYNTSDEIWSSVFPPVFQSNTQLGSCLDNVPTIVQFSPMDQFWLDNPFPMLVQGQTGCGYSVAHYPYLTPLAGWDAVNVGLGYRNIGQGRFWAADFDWQDQDQNDPTLPRLLGYMITHRR